jgi:hypothetical protein
MESSSYTTISVDRLRELEMLEASIPKIIDDAILEYKKTNLKKLHERDKANPEAINKRVKRYFERHREEINARRREKRLKTKIEKLTEISSPSNVLSTEPDASKNTILENPIKVESIIMRSTLNAISKSENPIVRKQAKSKKELQTEPKDITDSLTRSHNVKVRFDI